MPTTEQVRATVEAYVDAFSRGDKEAVLALWHAEGVWHDPVGQPPHVGHDGIGAFWDQTHAMAEDIRLVPSAIVCAADEAAMVFAIHTNLGGTWMTMDAVEIFTVDDDGRIVLAKAYWDMASMRPRDE